MAACPQRRPSTSPRGASRIQPAAFAGEWSLKSKRFHTAAGRVNISWAVNLETIRRALMSDPQRVEWGHARSFLNQDRSANPQGARFMSSGTTPRLPQSARCQGLFSQSQCRIQPEIQLPLLFAHISSRSSGFMSGLCTNTHPPIAHHQAEAFRRPPFLRSCEKHPAGMDEIPRQWFRQLPRLNPRELVFWQ